MDLSKDLPDVHADPAQIGQVVMNLVLNAINAITPPGKIEVRTRLAGRSVELEVADTGCGIPQENIGRVFEPFFTTRAEKEGSGLGLAVSYGIVKKHHGDIEVASELGKGSTFTVRLPANG
jgi:signal transduction histidine kinase